MKCATVQTVTADGNCSFRMFCIVLQDEGQCSVRTAEARITRTDKATVQYFSANFCIYEIARKDLPGKTRCVRGKIDCEAAMPKQQTSVQDPQCPCQCHMSEPKRKKKTELNHQSLQSAKLRQIKILRYLAWTQVRFADTAFSLKIACCQFNGFYGSLRTRI